jgi:hypothetical protein
VISKLLNISAINLNDSSFKARRFIEDYIAAKILLFYRDVIISQA